MRAKSAPTGPAPTGREAVWAAMHNEGPSTIQDLSRLTGLETSTIRDYLSGLQKAGIVGLAGHKDSPLAEGATRIVYAITRDLGVDAPRVRKDGTLLLPSGRTRMWRSMRILGESPIKDLAVAASLPEAPVTDSEALYYCRHLVNGRYLVQKTTGAKKLVRFQLLPSRYTGPKAPMIRRVRELYDPNTGKVAWSKIQEEDL